MPETTKNLTERQRGVQGLSAAYGCAPDGEEGFPVGIGLTAAFGLLMAPSCMYAIVCSLYCTGHWEESVQYGAWHLFSVLLRAI